MTCPHCGGEVPSTVGMVTCAPINPTACAPIGPTFFYGPEANLNATAVVPINQTVGAYGAPQMGGPFTVNAPVDRPR